ncbi:MAG: 3-hydroxyacyl-CoA dehydrogenase family protein [Ginsengibacter sp.]
MQLIILANQLQEQEISSKKINEGVEVVFVDSEEALLKYPNMDAMMLLDPNVLPGSLRRFRDKIIFLNSVSQSLEPELSNYVSRINGWTTFLKNEVWEIVSRDGQRVSKILNCLGWKFVFVADKPGFVSARIVAMIINEAYFALGDQVSSKAEIDTAMKLGTNYPFGPFEWSEKIGLKNIYSLLKALSDGNPRYEIAAAMKKEIEVLNA